MKKILLVLEKKMSTLPPLINIIEVLKESNKITVIVTETEKSYLSDDIEFIECQKKFRHNNKFTRAFNRLYYKKNFFKNTVPKIIEEGNYDIVWVMMASGSSALFSLKEDFNGRAKYICSVYELYDTFPEILKKIKKLVSTADKVVVPEFNRANISRVWFDLKETPFVLPNKSYKMPVLSNPDIEKKLEPFKNKKIILFQGHIHRDRSIQPLCEAINRLDGYVFVLMGVSHHGYAEELSSKYDNVHFIGFINPPDHLQFTSKSYIGIVSYGHTVLNAIFCAPNKIWEYSGYGIPMICNNIPGLVYTVGASNAGICVDMDNADQIYEAILNIEENYSTLSDNCKQMFDSVDFKSMVNEIIS